MVLHPRKDSADIKIHLQAPNAHQTDSHRTRTAAASGLLPDWKTYRARPCISSAGHVGGADSPVSLFRRNVNSKPKPLGPSVPVNLKGEKHFQFNYHRIKFYSLCVVVITRFPQLKRNARVKKSLQSLLYPPVSCGYTCTISAQPNSYTGTLEL